MPLPTHIRHGFGAARPYIYGYLDLSDLVTYAFGAVEIERHQFSPESFHLEMRISDSVVVLETGTTLPEGATVASIYVYVDDTDAAYERALEKGATSIMAPGDRPYSERSAGVKDSFGNVWYIATFKRQDS